MTEQPKTQAATIDMLEKAELYLNRLCIEIPTRAVGSEGNRQATRFFQSEVEACGWEADATEFEAMDWEDSGAFIECGSEKIPVLSSPYSLGCDEKAELVSVSNVEELEGADMRGRIVFLHGEIASEQLMPKNFVFYNPEHHQQIVSLLEKSRARAIIAATTRNVALAGGVYPFPLIEDGDFDIPSVYMKAEEGEKLMPFIGQPTRVVSNCRRIMGKGYNVIAKKGTHSAKRIVLTAHIDAKKGTPGAIDNTTGVIVLLLLAKLLENYRGGYQLEMAAFNGEDYYAAPGQMIYVAANQNRFQEILLDINIDGAGIKEFETTFSLFDLPEPLQSHALTVINRYSGIKEGVLWPQGDHSIFLQQGVPAIAVSSAGLIERMDCQDITHTPKDNPSIVDCSKVVEAADAIYRLISMIA
jgi:aminopeptidase YwaD